jgi:AbrB family looped-hinge helix DNA binding protein
MEHQENRSKPQSTTKIFGKGKCYIPSKIRRRLQLRDGDLLIWELTSSGEVKISKAKIVREYG